jgi:hypothetical protein
MCVFTPLAEECASVATRFAAKETSAAPSRNIMDAWGTFSDRHPTPMPKHALEAQLMALTREFVAKLVEAIRNASFVEVAALPGAHRAASRRTSRRSTLGFSTRKADANRQTVAARRAELSSRIMKVLEASARPLGVRALASEIGVAPDLLVVPIRELRASSRIRKHGEKRSTTYSAQ